ncbi:unnamed protein product [Cylindrotheca closterium]|uniref:DUF1995 domain-containing protein n=1 Tax=Cylindrotheca closterium TaxID=2856 RepID=A0AAD2JM49_9STRA|nr:unnamed protein product [Cylindrotheca closterium]
MLLLSASTNPNDNEEAGNQNGGKYALNAMRMILQQSWDTETMGEIPADANVGAKEAFETIQRAHADGVSVCFVDLLLPAYDIKQGPELYDEVMAVEYCIALSEFLDGNTEILVKDDKVRNTVSRILEVREKEAEEERERAAQEAARERERLVVEAAKREAEVKRKAMIRDQILAKEADDEGSEDEDEDNENDDGGDEPSGESADASDLDAFRQSLMASWDSEADDVELESKEEAPSELGDRIVDSDSAGEPREAIDEEAETEVSATTPVTSTPYVKRYRLATLFGNREIKKSSEMMEQVVETIRQNALPQEDEKNMVILSSLSIQETVAVRSLVDKYQSQKNIILVNCKLDPLPPELRSAQTVYSIFPLIAKPKGPVESSDEKPPRVVVLRRYPKPWEIYVDIGEGFQLADSISPTSQTKRELPLELITDSVRKWLR